MGCSTYISLVLINKLNAQKFLKYNLLLIFDDSLHILEGIHLHLNKRTTTLFFYSGGQYDLNGNVATVRTVTELNYLI